MRGLGSGGSWGEMAKIIRWKFNATAEYPDFYPDEAIDDKNNGDD
jgi:hypothetical protein